MTTTLTFYKESSLKGALSQAAICEHYSIANMVKELILGRGQSRTDNANHPWQHFSYRT